MPEPRYAMTGAEHYREAGQLLAVAARTRADAYTKEDLEEAAQMTAEAGVHATLALAAVTAEVATVTGGVRGSTATAWREAGAW